MMGLGIDSVEIARFAQWHTYSKQRLYRIFSREEIEYCLAIPTKSAERFAVRFAAREALYKALSSSFAPISLPFLTLCRNVALRKQSNGALEVIVNWNALMPDIDMSRVQILISCTHTKNVATAVVILSKKNSPPLNHKNLKDHIS